MGAPLVRLTPGGQERKAIACIVDTTLHRCDGRRPQPHKRLATLQALVAGADAVSRPVGPRRKWRLMDATCPAQLGGIGGDGEGQVTRPLWRAIPDWERVQHISAGCCRLTVLLRISAWCRAQSCRLRGQRRQWMRWPPSPCPGQAAHRLWPQVQSSHSDIHRHQTRYMQLWEHSDND